MTGYVKPAAFGGSQSGEGASSLPSTPPLILLYFNQLNLAISQPIPCIKSVTYHSGQFVTYHRIEPRYHPEAEKGDMG